MTAPTPKQTLVAEFGRRVFKGRRPSAESMAASVIARDPKLRAVLERSGVKVVSADDPPPPAEPPKPQIIQVTETECYKP